jgi:hypothetical protein
MERIDFQFLHLVEAQVDLNHILKVSKLEERNLVIGQVDTAYISEMSHVIFKNSGEMLLLNVD